jgi:hypothetical protein
MMKRLMGLVLVMLLPPLLLSGCADFSTVNTAIMDNNRMTREAFARGMAECGDNAACQVGVTAAYFSNAGQQELFRPETAKDYLQAGLPYANLALTGFGMYWNGSGNGTSGDRSSIYVKGDGNTFSLGNKLSASEYSSATMSLNPSYTRWYDGGYNRDYTGQQPITDEGLQ